MTFSKHLIIHLQRQQLLSTYAQIYITRCSSNILLKMHMNVNHNKAKKKVVTQIGSLLMCVGTAFEVHAHTRRHTMRMG